MLNSCLEKKNDCKLRINLLNNNRAEYHSPFNLMKTVASDSHITSSDLIPNVYVKEWPWHSHCNQSGYSLLRYFLNHSSDTLRHFGSRLTTKVCLHSNSMSQEETGEVCLHSNNMSQDKKSPVLLPEKINRPSKHGPLTCFVTGLIIIIIIDHHTHKPSSKEWQRVGLSGFRVGS